MKDEALRGIVVDVQLPMHRVVLLLGASGELESDADCHVGLLAYFLRGYSLDSSSVKAARFTPQAACATPARVQAI
jgi:hypothetical protein